MELGISGKSALVTASTYGLGFAIANALINEGCHVVINSRSEENLQVALNKLGPNASGVLGDLSSFDDRKRIIEDAKQKVGNIDILVVSTAHPPTRPFSTSSDDEWELGYQLLMRTPLELSRALIPSMRSKGYGRLIFIGSIFGLEAEVSSVIQSTFRAGLNNFTKCISVEEAPYGITANVICPGYFDTPLVRNLAGQYANESNRTVEVVLNDWKTFSPMKTFGRPEDVGAFVAFLCSKHGDYFTGSAVHIDGGALKRV